MRGPPAAAPLPLPRDLIHCAGASSPPSPHIATPHGGAGMMSASSHHAPALGVCLVTTAAVFWSTGGLIVRLVGTDPWTTVFWRSVFCAAVLGVAVAVTYRGRLHRLARDVGGAGVVMAACFALSSTCFIMSLARTSVANALIIQSLSPFIAGIGGWLCLGERVRRRTWGAMAVALGGTVLMLWGSTGAGSRTGDLLALGTATAFAAATVVVRRHRSVPMPAAAGLAAAMSALLAIGPSSPSSASAGDLVLLAVFGAVQLGGGLLLFTAGARLIPVAEASLIAVLESVLGPIWVWLVVGEYPGLSSIAGGAVILSALVAHTASDLVAAPSGARARVPS